ncbi:MAG: M14 family metallopeptidase [Pseudomonadales bacterium]
MGAVSPVLRRFDAMPDGLLDCPAERLEALLGGPALIYLRGRRDPPLFVSVLLHGNEHSGWNGLRKLLAEPGELPRSLIVLIGNVEAAAQGLRSLPHQQDYNRIWRGVEGPEAALVADVLGALDRPLFAALDLHNNTGHNPHYAVLTDLSPMNLGLAYLFSDKAVYVREPDTVLTRVFGERCPAVAVEAGPVSDPNSDERCYDYVKRCLALELIPDADLGAMKLFRTRVRVHVADTLSFAFAGDGIGAPLLLTGGVEAVNFHELGAGTIFGTSRVPLRDALRVLDVEHRDVTDEFLVLEGEQILLRQAVTPAMYTTDSLVIRQDCLCYFMETLPLAP